MTASSLFLLAAVRIEAFSPSPMRRATSYNRNSRQPSTDSNNRSIIDTNHGRPFFATTSSAPAAGTGGIKQIKQNNNSHKKKTKQSNNNTNNNAKRNRNKNGNRRHHNNGPHAGLTIDELKQLTEYHLSQNISPHNGTISVGSMSPSQMHEFSRLISSWSKLYDNNHNHRNRNRNRHHRRQDKVLAAEMAEQCLRELLEEHTAGNAHATKVVFSTMDHYYLVIKAWLQVGGYNDLIHANSLLELMERNHNKSNGRKRLRLPPSSMKCYAAVLGGWCKFKSRGSEVKAEEILNRMKRLDVSMMMDNDDEEKGDGKKNNHNNSRISMVEVKHYNNVMNRIAISGKANAGEEAERLLLELIDSYKKHQSSTSGGDNHAVARTEVNATTNNNSTAANTSNTTKPSAKRSRRILAPNRNSFNTVIKAYANANDEQQKSRSNSNSNSAADNAQRILAMMEDPITTLGLNDHLDNNKQQQLSENEIMDMTKSIMPDKISYTSIIMACANTNNKHNNNNNKQQPPHDGGNKGNNKLVEELLDRMIDMYKSGKNDRVKPDTVTYNAVLKVWGKSGHPKSGERSEALLDKMLQLYEETGDSDIIPDEVTFNSVIHNIANSHVRDSPQRAMRLLERMDQLYESGLIKARPDIISYNSVLNAFAKSGGPQSASRAEELLDTLEARVLYNNDDDDADADNNGRSRRRRRHAIRPDVYSYNIVISAWSNCGDANKAVALLDRMTALTNEGRAHVKPDAMTYNTVLHAWSQSSDRNAPVKALGLLEIMLRLHEGGDRSANPDVMSFTTVINAFSKSKFPRKARQARDLLRRMKSLYEEKGQERMKPNVFVYAAVLNACAYTFGREEEKEEALKIGIETYEELQSLSSLGIETNHVAYGSFLRVCRRLMPEDSRRNHFITRAFKQCCSDGQVGEYVLKQLRAVPKLYATLLQAYIVDGGEVSYRDLPESWTCNVKDKRRKWKSDEPVGKRRNERSYS